MSKPRYAVYYAPTADSALWRFGSAVLGYDAATGEDVPFLVPPGCDPATWPPLTEEPRRYGFHATLKAPFELAEGCSEEALRRFARNHAAELEGVALAGLSVAAIGSFIALTPSAPTEELERFAFALVQAFEPFRAELTEADRARRLKSPLTLAQHAYLKAYGYPYVGDAFRFHMTLTGSLPEERLAPVSRALATVFATAMPAGPVRLDRFALFRQDDRKSRFRLLESYPLG